METVINMTKMEQYDRIDMVKADGTPIKRVFIGARWDMTRFAKKAASDMDIHAMGGSGGHTVQFPQNIVNYMTWRNYGASAYPWCKFSGDNQDGDDSKGGIDFAGTHYDEYFVIDYDKFPADLSELTICLSIYQAIARKQNFGLISNAHLDVYDYEDPTRAWTYSLSENPDFESLNAVEIGRLFRGQNGFRFEAIGDGYTGGMTELYDTFGLKIKE